MSFFSRLFGRKDRKEKAAVESLPNPAPVAGPEAVPAAIPAVVPASQPAMPEYPAGPSPETHAAANALRDRLSARWPGIDFDIVQAIPDLSAEWASIGRVDEATLEAIGARASEIAKYWSPAPRFMRTVCYAPDVDALMEHVPSDLSPTRAAVGVTVTPGPMIYAVIAFAVP